MSYYTSEQDVKRMFEAATANQKNCYVPYSHYPVSAALLCKDGTIVLGVNVENCSYPNGCCAERSAIFGAVSNGHRDFVSILITSKMGDDFILPCGMCRQVIAEWGNLEVISTKGNGEIKRYHISDLLPEAFTPADLTK